VTERIPQRASREWRIHDAPWDSPDGSRLRAAQREEVIARYGGVDTEPGIHPSADDIAVFLVAYSATGEAAGCGGLRQLSDGSAELKRMFVVPEERGSGIATAILKALEQRALERGWITLRLETGVEQPEAVRFYEREGYALIPNFGDYEGVDTSLCYERVLGFDTRAH
jgi:putative acetyltransferase